LVLVNPALNVPGHTDVETPGSAGHDVDVERARHTSNIEGHRESSQSIGRSADCIAA
jgi:hypothetical protein